MESLPNIEEKIACGFVGLSFEIIPLVEAVGYGLDDARVRAGLDLFLQRVALGTNGDADKGKGGTITVKPSLVIETSPGNFHYWYLFTRAIPAAQAKLIGDAIRANSGADKDTGVVTQPYRIAGTPNFPTAEKQARGRITVEATRITEQTGRLWDPDELLAAFSRVASAAAATPIDPEATLPEELLKDIREGGVGKGNDRSRSALFQSVVDQLKRRHWTVEDIVMFEKYPNGVAKKYIKRLRKEVERSYNKAVSGVILVAAAPAGASPGGASTGATPQATAAPASTSCAAASCRRCPVPLARPAVRLH